MRLDSSRLSWRGPRPGPIAATVTEHRRSPATSWPETDGDVSLADVAKRDTEPGPGLTCSLTTGFPGRASSTLGPNSDLPLLTRGRSRMRESRTYGSVRGAGSNPRPYRDRDLSGAASRWLSGIQRSCVQGSRNGCT